MNPASIRPRMNFNPAKLAILTAIGSVLFTLTWLVLGFFNQGYTLYGATVQSYSPIAQPISGLGLGNTAIWMNLNFMLFGGLLLLLGMVGVFVKTAKLGTAARIGNVFLLGMPLGSFFCGIFTLEAGFPHYVSAMIAFGFPVVGFIVVGLAWRRKNSRKAFGIFLIAASPITLALIVGYMVTFNPIDAGNNRGIAGLTERILIVWVLAVYAAYGWRCRGKAEGIGEA